MATHAVTGPFGTGRKFLVFVRGGAASLHREWLEQDPRRNWDCVFSWWDAEPKPRGEELLVTGGLLKCDAFAVFDAAYPGLVDHYDYVLIADDDVRFAAGDISRLMTICAAHRLELAQPALRWGSCVNHPVTLRHPFTVLRAVSFIEMMVPVFSIRTLRRLRDTFTLSQSGSGVDWAWAHALRGGNAMHVVDVVACDHTKPVDPVNGALYRLLRSKGIDSWEEYRAIRERLPIPRGVRTKFGGHLHRPWVPFPLRNLLTFLYWQYSRGTHRLGWSDGRMRASRRQVVAP
jgi:hypothetical protein